MGALEMTLDTRTLQRTGALAWTRILLAALMVDGLIALAISESVHAHLGERWGLDQPTGCMTVVGDYAVDLCRPQSDIVWVDPHECRPAPPYVLQQLRQVGIDPRSVGVCAQG